MVVSFRTCALGPNIGSPAGRVFRPQLNAKRLMRLSAKLPGDWADHCPYRKLNPKDGRDEP